MAADVTVNFHALVTPVYTFSVETELSGNP